MINEHRRVPGSTRRQRKVWLRTLLQERQLEIIAELAKGDSFVLRTLPQLLFDSDKLICWRAIEALGKVAAVIAETDLERVRVMVRGQIWQMNDESGNVGWYAAEAVGEILYNVPHLIDEYGPLLLSYLHEEPFERGAHWAVARVASVRPDIYRGRIDELLPSLDDDDPYIRAFAMLALTRIHAEGSRECSARLEDDAAIVSYYDFETGSMRETAVYELTQSAKD